MIARIALVVVAVVVLAWLAVMERDTRLFATAQSVSGKLSERHLGACARPRSPAGLDCRGFDRAARDYRAADLLNPDTGPDLARGLLVGSGDWRRQTRAIDAVLRREPANVSAWSALIFVSRDHDRATVKRALRALHRLDPIDIPAP